MFLRSSISGSQVSHRHYSSHGPHESRVSQVRLTNRRRTATDFTSYHHTEVSCTQRVLQHSTSAQDSSEQRESQGRLTNRRCTAAKFTSYHHTEVSCTQRVLQHSTSAQDSGELDLSFERYPVLELLPELYPSTLSSPRPSTYTLASSIRSSLTSVSLQKRLKIIVRRTCFETLEDTLARFPSSLLGDKLKRGYYFNELLDAFIFEDRCPRSFDAILFYYQSEGILSRPNDIPRLSFIKELEFFEITKFLDTRQEQDAYHLNEIMKQQQLCPARSQKEQFWRLLIHKNKTWIGQLWTAFHLILTILSIILICAKTLPLGSLFNLPTTIYSEIFLTDFCFNMIYTLELGGLLLFAPNFGQYSCTIHGVFDICTSIFYYPFFFVTLYNVTQPTIQRITNLMLTTRIFKLFKFCESARYILYTLTETRYYLQLFATSATILVFWFAVIIYVAENGFQKSDANDFNFGHEDTSIKNIGDAVWYTVITITGVGYGDVYPSTVLGKMFGGALCLIGLLLFCLPTSVLMNKFIDLYFLAEAIQNESERQRILSTREELLTI